MIKQFQNDDYMVAGNKVEHLSQFFSGVLGYRQQIDLENIFIYK